MTQNFIGRAKRRIRRLGYPELKARFFAREFFILMNILCGLFGLLDSTPNADIVWHMGAQFTDDGGGIPVGYSRAGIALFTSQIQRP